ncbi:unnamed protein product [Aphanomyces euteiches]|uniref:Uncharacterized protein n=1 Tax=Aphanomyces euteiches TaxID=100861 RepID=A0A6G0WTM7_9STRA|nr:hypothetical protein Ae201684_011894 [Aphanomyces euteiches]KAH9089179.1 hypothetical protein Ae201684P_001385 [Aphanomyces euteiches]KAH9153618.1 hypothetical protein AeRB84_004156 [Aphanomyces euteiches]
MTTTCFFHGCTNPTPPDAWKCTFHRNRKRCVVQACQNQVYARNVCAKHGGKRKCHVDGCDQPARTANVCYTHGARFLKKLCTVEGCKVPAQLFQRCVRHGGRRTCSVSGCQSFARGGGHCHRHGRGRTIALEEKSVKLEPLDDDTTAPVMRELDVLDLCTPMPYKCKIAPIEWSQELLDTILSL